MVLKDRRQKGRKVAHLFFDSKYATFNTTDSDKETLPYARIDTYLFEISLYK
jgi:hypothetical protein